MVLRDFYLVIGTLIKGRRNGNKLWLKNSFAEIRLRQDQVHRISPQGFILYFTNNKKYNNKLSYHLVLNFEKTRDLG